MQCGFITGQCEAERVRRYGGAVLRGRPGITVSGIAWAVFRDGRNDQFLVDRCDKNGEKPVPAQPHHALIVIPGCPEQGCLQAVVITATGDHCETVARQRCGQATG